MRERERRERKKGEMERRNKKKKQRSERGKHGEKEKKRKRDVEEDRWENIWSHRRNLYLRSWLNMDVIPSKGRAKI